MGTGGGASGLEGDLCALLEDWADRAVVGEPGRAGVPGVVFAVAGRARVLVCRGLADPTARRAMTAKTSFHLGSLGKPVATLGVLTLCTERGWSLDTPVMDLVSSWSFDADQANGFEPREITLRQVLSHTSGAPHGRYRRLKWRTPVPPPGALLDGALGRATRLKLAHRPGTLAEYTAFAFPLLELVIEDQTGVRFPRWMRERVLGPLGAGGIDYVPGEALFGELAVGHRERGAAVRPCRTVFASSGLFGRPMALAKILASTMTGEAGRPRGAGVIDPALIDEMLRPQARTAMGDEWGLGVMRSDLAGRPGFRHGGWLRGWFSIAQGFQDDGIVVVVSSNSMAFKGWARALMRSAGEVVAKHAATDQPTAA